MNAKIGPGVVCVVVPPSHLGDSIRNRFVTVLRLEPGEVFDINGRNCYRDGWQIVWWVLCATPIWTTHGTLSEVPVPQDWLRPISGPGIDISEHQADPVHQVIEEAARA